MTPLPSSQEVITVERWRAVACDFHAIQWCLRTGTLRPDFEPVDLDRLRRKPDTEAIRGVYSFLLHIYNSANRFDLGEIQRWDKDHIAAFCNWANGSKTGRACHYF